MSAADKMGRSYRKLGSLLSAREVRDEDEQRTMVRADLSEFAKRADAIAAEALKIARQLDA